MKLSFDAVDLDPVVRAVVAEVLAQHDATDAKLGNRLAFPEPEAAALLGIAPHVLRDARRRGEVMAKRVGKRFLYSREGLARWLNERA